MKYMLTDRDIQKLLAVFASKEDIMEMQEDISGLRESMQSLIISVDKMTKSIETLMQEYAAIKTQLDRHENWIKQLAERAGLKLDY